MRAACLARQTKCGEWTPSEGEGTGPPLQATQPAAVAVETDSARTGRDEAVHLRSASAVAVESSSDSKSADFGQMPAPGLGSPHVAGAPAQLFLEPALWYSLLLLETRPELAALMRRR